MTNQREIRFRAWKPHKGAKNGLGIMWGMKELLDSSDYEMPSYLDDILNGERQNLILMQYTGLKDKNGKEIYEGDICENGDWESDAHAHNYRKEVVEWVPTEASFVGWNYNEDGMTCEVIGNIYENPDLLGNKE